MKRYDLSTITERIEKKGLTKDSFKQILMNLCDSDFNGDNGEDYFVESLDSNGNEVLKSKFDAMWDNLVSDETNVADKGWSIAERILTEAYSYDTDYYMDYSVEVFNTADEIIIFVAYTH